MDRRRKLLENVWLDKLSEADRLQDLMNLCTQICNNGGYGKPPTGSEQEAPDNAGLENVTTTLIQELYNYMCSNRIPHTYRKMISKACFFLIASLLDHPEHETHDIASLLRTIKEGSIEIQCLAIYGMLHSPVLKRCQGIPHLSDILFRLHVLFKSPDAGYTRWFHTISECVMTTIERPIKLPGWPDLPVDVIWLVALYNLGSPFHGTRQIIIGLLKQLVRNRTFAYQTIMPALRSWNWQNRNKYHLLVALSQEFRLDEILQRCEIDKLELATVLKKSLQYKHLICVGHALFRMCPLQAVLDLMVEIIYTEKIVVLRHMAKYWLEPLSTEARADLFQMLKLHELQAHTQQLPPYLSGQKYEKLFLLMHIFRREFTNHSCLYDILMMLGNIENLNRPLSPKSRVLLIKILAYQICYGKNDNIGQALISKQLEQYIGVVINSSCPLTLTNVAVEECRLLLNMVHEGRLSSYAIPMLLYSTYDSFLLPNKTPPSTHRQTVTALRLFGLLVERAVDDFPVNGRWYPRPDSIAWLNHVLPPGETFNHRFIIFTNKINQLEQLLHSENEEVRNAAFRIRGIMTFAYTDNVDLRFHLANAFTFEKETFLANFNNLLESATQVVFKSIERFFFDDFYTSVMAAEEHRCFLQLDQVVGQATQICFTYPEILSDQQYWGKLFALVETVNLLFSKVLICLNDSVPITDFGLEFTTTRFEIVDRSMQLLLDKSPKWASDLASGAVNQPTETDRAKCAMRNVICKTLRSIAVFAENYGLFLVNHEDQLHGDFEDKLSICVWTFTIIIINCFNQVAMESTASCMGRLVQHIMSQKSIRSEGDRRLAPTLFETWFDMYLTKKPMPSVEFRACRGYMYLLNSIIRNDADRNMSLLNKYLCMHLRLGLRVTPAPVIGVLDLHQLDLLVKDSSLNNVMLAYIDELMIVALTAFRCQDYSMRNAALQLFNSCSKKLAWQEQKYVDAQCEWTPVYISLDELISKLPRTMQYIERELHTMLKPVENEQIMLNGAHGVTAFLLMVLQFVSRCEYRNYNEAEHGKFVCKLKSFVWKLLGHEQYQVRKLAAHCYTQLRSCNLRDNDQEFFNAIEDLLVVMFNQEGGINFRHGICLAIRGYLRRYVTLRHFTTSIYSGFSKQFMLATIKGLLIRHWKGGNEASFRYRLAVYELLIYVGFEPTTPVMQNMTMNDAFASNGHAMDQFLLEVKHHWRFNELAFEAIFNPNEEVLEQNEELEQDDY